MVVERKAEIALLYGCISEHVANIVFFKFDVSGLTLQLRKEVYIQESEETGFNYFGIRKMTLIINNEPAQSNLSYEMCLSFKNESYYSIVIARTSLIKWLIASVAWSKDI